MPFALVVYQVTVDSKKVAWGVLKRTGSSQLDAVTSQLPDRNVVKMNKIMSVHSLKSLFIMG